MQSLLISIILLTQIFPAKTKTMLCLGDSYTIGESVEAAERFPEQTVALLNQEEIRFNKPEIIAKTGWTTENLIQAIQKANPKHGYDCVTLLIGVNDQYRGIETAVYRVNFETLLQAAIECAGNKPKKVFVISIPDYGVTPFALNGSTSPETISAEIKEFNSINRLIAEGYKVNYIDITPISQKAKTESDLLAFDGLHPSGKMYAQWAELLAAAIRK